MLYPFIYTRSMHHDFRVVTSKSLTGVPRTIVHLATDIARTLIDAEDNQLEEPTWVLVKKDGFLLWGMSALNKVLGELNQDKEKRPTRGFFGFISDSNIAKLPYSISYFKRLYETYVVPIWDSYAQMDQIVCNMPEILGYDFIEKSSRLCTDINTEESICRFFPGTTECKSLIEAVFSYNGNCSIATNIHRKKQCVEFGEDNISFTNAVMSSDSKLSNIEDVKVIVTNEIIDSPKYDMPDEEHIDDINDEPVCPICGSPVSDYGNICTNCKKRQQNKEFMKFGLYGFMVLICLLLYFEGPDIWKMILSPEQSEVPVLLDVADVNTTSPFLNTSKSEITIQDAAQDDVFRIEYNSSSNITKVVSHNNWIRIVTPTEHFSKKGIIEFTCATPSGEQRDGSILLTNRDGIEIVITIHQTISINGSEADNGSSVVNSKENNEIPGELTMDSSANEENNNSKISSIETSKN